MAPYERLELEALRADSRLAPAGLEGGSGSCRAAKGRVLVGRLRALAGPTGRL